jgi:internalin A
MSLTKALKRIQQAQKHDAHKLNLSGLGLTEIPAEIFELTQLIHLNLSRNQLIEIIGLEKLTQLTHLDLSDNQLTEITELEKLTQVTVLRLTGNQLVEIKGLENLAQLAELYLSYNQLVEIKGLENLRQLTKLRLSDNKLAEIKGLENLTQVTYLDLSYNEITEIKGLEKLRQLTVLNLRDNQLAEIKGLENLNKLIYLNLSSNSIPEIKGLENLIQLTYLNLSSNLIPEIKGLETLAQLNYLYLPANSITEIKGLEALTRLTELDLSQNRLAEIKGLEKMTQLKELYLSGNQSAEIKGLGKLTQLTHLDLSDNGITEITGLESLAQLIELQLSGNKITKTKGLQTLVNLNKLLLENNSIIEIPEQLLEVGQPISWTTTYDGESGIYIGGNAIMTPPLDIVKQGDEAIREYFKQLKKSGAERLNEAKLILLGDGRSGKTSLANRLLGKELPKEADRTVGVDIVIGAYNFPLANGKDFKINIWDFAGQDKYKTLHQLFYTDSSLYVMVAESGNMTTDFDDWFQTAELFGEGSPLVLVLNEFKAGIGMGSFDSTHWKKQFPELLKEVFTVDLGTKQNFPAVEEYIRLLAQTLPHAQSPFPANWAAIRRILNERRNEQYITLKEYLEICKGNDLPERESALILSSILHKVGDCLHYQKSGLLKQFIILKNEWATDAVYKILDDSVVASKKCGFFDMKDVERIWHSDEYRDMRPQLLELMKQFKLAYQLPGREEFVTPPLLPPGRPENILLPNLDSLELYIEYEFLPKALLTQFIVTRHTDIAEGRTLVWRHGVILNWEGEARAEVSKTKLGGRDAFYIRTQGSNRKGMMTVILKTFRELHADYKGIKYEERVPCICEDCRSGRNKQDYFDLAKLNRRLENGKDEVDCNTSVKPVNIMELLENAFILEKFKAGHAPQLKENVAREASSKPRVLKIFLASSNELLEEREKIEQALGRKNKILKKDGFNIELLIWEDGKHIGKSLRSQDDYNLEIEQCDLFAMLFYSKVGKFSLEEFKLASSLLEKKGAPRLRVFQKDEDLPKNQSRADSNSRHDFLERLQKIGHFPVLFQNADMLVNELVDAVDKLLLDKAFVERLSFE